MPYTCEHTRKLSAGSSYDVFAVNFTDWLDSGETISSVTITEVDTSHLTLASKLPNAAAIEVNEDTVAIGKGVQCSVNATNAITGKRYTFEVTPTTNASRVVIFHFNMDAV